MRRARDHLFSRGARLLVVLAFAWAASACSVDVCSVAHCYADGGAGGAGGAASSSGTSSSAAISTGTQ